MPCLSVEACNLQVATSVWRFRLFFPRTDGTYEDGTTDGGGITTSFRHDLQRSTVQTSAIGDGATEWKPKYLRREPNARRRRSSPTNWQRPLRPVASVSLRHKNTSKIINYLTEKFKTKTTLPNRTKIVLIAIRQAAALNQQTRVQKCFDNNWCTKSITASCGHVEVTHVRD